jgi:hypothetical protein
MSTAPRPSPDRARVYTTGILKWNGFLQLSDTAIYLFTDEFRLHLPGGPYDFPAPAVMAFLYVDRIVACLKRERANLSKPCQTVIKN